MANPANSAVQNLLPVQALFNLDYTGATQAVNLGAYDLTVNGLTVGVGAGTSTNSSNTAIGKDALKYNTSSGYNTAIGMLSLNSNTIGRSNTAIGYWAMQANTTGNWNISTGGSSLMQNTSGSNNTAYGSGALWTNITGNNNTALGSNADVASNNLTNATAIGNGAIVNASNTIQLGNADVVSVKTNGVITSAKGFLPPRISSSQRDAISLPETGLIVYCSNCGIKGQMQYYDGSAWVNMIGGAPAAGIMNIGMNFQGGKVAYILQVGDPGYDPSVVQGLIITTSDLGKATWGCYGTSISTSHLLGSGLSNTNNIVASCNQAGTAAKICADLVVDGYSDWYLPSIKEWEKIYPNSSAIGISLINSDYSIDPPNSIGNNGYWSSTQAQVGGGLGDGATEGKWMAYPQGDPNNTYNKQIQMRVRAIRAF